MRISPMLFALALSGCATIGTLGEPQTRKKVYSGTIRDMQLECAHRVELAPIQGLNQKLKRRLAQKETEISELKQRPVKSNDFWSGRPPPI